jgi:hypothetical protein
LLLSYRAGVIGLIQKRVRLVIRRAGLAIVLGSKY